MRARRFRAPVIAVVAAAVLAPVAASAGTGYFTTRTNANTLYLSNGGGGRVLYGYTSVGSQAAYLQSAGTGNTNTLGVWSFSTGSGSGAIVGRSRPTTGEHYGVTGTVEAPLGAGVRGTDASGKG